MSKKASDILARMKEITSREKSRAQVHKFDEFPLSEALPSEQSVNLNASIPGKKIRYTVDLDINQHRFLKLFSLEAGTESSRVIRAILEVLREDPDFANQILERLSKQKPPRP